MVDNIVFLLYLIFTYLFCYLSYIMLTLLDSSDFHLDKGYMSMKKVILIIMGLQVFLYSVSVLIVSYYSPKLALEKNLFMLIVSSIGVNSIVYLICMIGFIWTFKYDIYFVNFHMVVLPDSDTEVDLLIDYDNLGRDEV